MVVKKYIWEKARKTGGQAITVSRDINNFFDENNYHGFSNSPH